MLTRPLRFLEMYFFVKKLTEPYGSQFCGMLAPVLARGETDRGYKVAIVNTYQSCLVKLKSSNHLV